MKDESALDRLSQVMREQGLLRSDLARAANITPQAVGNWFKTGSISVQSLNACARKFNFSLDWLLNGDVSKSGGRAGQYYLDCPEGQLESDIVLIPFLVEVEDGVGQASVRLDTDGPKIGFSKSTIKFLGVDVEHAACIKVSGKLLEPVLPDGSMVAIDTKNTTVKDGDIYAIDWGGSLFVKILNRRPNRQLKIRHFDHTKYPDEIVSSEDAKSIKILGKVFWYSALV